MVEKLHDNILELRMYGSLKNEFMYVDCETLKVENKKLVLENIQLARELKDSQNIIQQYESPAYKKNGDTSEPN